VGSASPARGFNAASPWVQRRQPVGSASKKKSNCHVTLFSFFCIPLFQFEERGAPFLPTSFLSAHTRKSSAMAEQDLAAAAAAVLSAGRTSAFTRPTPAAVAATPATTTTAAPSSNGNAAAPAPAPAPLEIALFAQLAQLVAPHGTANGIPQQAAAAAAAAAAVPPALFEPVHRLTAATAASAPAAPLTAGAAAANGVGTRTRSGESRMSTTYASRHQLAEQRRRNRINER